MVFNSIKVMKNDLLVGNELSDAVINAAQHRLPCRHQKQTTYGIISDVRRAYAVPGPFAMVKLQ